MFTWEVVFAPNQSFEVTAGEGGNLQVVFESKGDDVATQQLPDGTTRVRFYGKLAIKSIPGGSANGSYEIPTLPVHMSSDRREGEQTTDRPSR